VQFDPTGLLFAPLGLMVVFYGGRKSKKSAPYMLMLMMLVVLPLTMGLACDTGTPAATTPVATATQPPGGTQVAGSATVAPTATSTVQAPSTQPVSCEEAPIATSTATPTPTPTCPLCVSNQYAQMLYDAVISQKNNLPPGFSIALLFALAAVETGGNNPAYQNSVTHGGAFQLRANSGHYHHPYEDSPAGYEQNVMDAIAVINENYNYAESTKEQTLWQVDLYGQFPNNQNEATAARTVLYYNGGFGWWDKNNPDSYVNKPPNKPYVGNVARMLAGYVPSSFGFSDPSLVTILQKVQDIVNIVVK